MITSVTAVPPPTPVSGATPAADAAASPAPSSAASAAPDQQAAAASAASSDPLLLSVERGHDGIYVYSLKDPSTGRLVAVIPRDHADSTSQGPDYHAGGYVKLTA